jgi:hypothetical protein
VPTNLALNAAGGRLCWGRAGYKIPVERGAPRRDGAICFLCIGRIESRSRLWDQSGATIASNSSTGHLEGKAGATVTFNSESASPLRHARLSPANPTRGAKCQHCTELSRFLADPSLKAGPFEPRNRFGHTSRMRSVVPAPVSNAKRCDVAPRTVSSARRIKPATNATPHSASRTSLP